MRTPPLAILYFLIASVPEALGRLPDFKAGFAMLAAGTTIPVLPALLPGSLFAMPSASRAVRPQKIVQQIGVPVTFENVANHADGWRTIAAATREKVRALSAHPSPISKFYPRRWSEMHCSCCAGNSAAWTGFSGAFRCFRQTSNQ